METVRTKLGEAIHGFVVSFPTEERKTGTKKEGFQNKEQRTRTRKEQPQAPPA